MLKGYCWISRGVSLDGVFSNIFIVQKQQLFTPALNRCGVAGSDASGAGSNVRLLQVLPCMRQISVCNNCRQAGMKFLL